MADGTFSVTQCMFQQKTVNFDTNFTLTYHFSQIKHHDGGNLQFANFAIVCIRLGETVLSTLPAFLGERLASRGGNVPIVRNMEYIIDKVAL